VVENQLHGLGAVFGSARLSLSRPIRHNADASICWSIVGGVELAEFRKWSVLCTSILEVLAEE